MKKFRNALILANLFVFHFLCFSYELRIQNFCNQPLILDIDDKKVKLESKVFKSFLVKKEKINLSLSCDNSTLKKKIIFVNNKPVLLSVIKKEELVLNEYKNNEVIAEKKLYPFKIEGRIIDEKTLLPVRNAMVTSASAFENSTTDKHGHFTLLSREKVSDLLFVHSNYEQLSITKAHSSSTYKMKKKGLELNSYTVLAPKLNGSVNELLEKRKNISQVSDFIGAEQISKTGDSDVASSLKRVTGLTLVDGKFVYIRGLGERYSNTLYNGASLPSPDPSRRVIPLDLFPTTIIRSIEVQKSYTPDKSGEFGGGTVSIYSKVFPRKLTINTSLELSYSNYDNFLTYQGGKSDWLGIDDGTRALPNSISKDSIASKNDLKKLSKHHNTKSKPLEETIVPGLKFSLGNTFKYKAWRFGILSGGLYNQKSDSETENKTLINLSQGKIFASRYKSEKAKFQKTIKTGVFLNSGLSYTKNHKLALEYLLVRKTSDSTSERLGLSSEDDEQEKITELLWQERQLTSLLFSGSHEFKKLNKLKLNWQFANSNTQFYEPDTRKYKYQNFEGNGLSFVGFRNPETYSRVFSEMKEKSQNYSANITLPLVLWAKLTSNLKLGFEQLSKGRISDVRRFSLASNNRDVSSVDKTEVLESIIDHCSQLDCFNYEETTRPTDSYSAKTNVSAYYSQMSLGLTTNLKSNLGFRYEKAQQEVSSFMLYTPTESLTATILNTQDIFPSFALHYNIAENQKLVASYSETISRPDVREMSDTLWRDEIEDIDVRGNPKLKAAIISNYDLRWEYYPNMGESFSFGLFYKNFSDPIEDVITSGSDPVVTYINADEANNYGFELEVRKKLKNISHVFPNMTFTSNFSWIYSSIVLSSIANIELTSKERSLQGQSPWMFNAMLDYSWENFQLEASLVYNVIGKRISKVGLSGQPDLYLEPKHQVDLVLSKKINDWNIKFKASNILHSKNIYSMYKGQKKSWLGNDFSGDKIVAKTVEKGASFGLSVSKSF